MRGGGGATEIIAQARAGLSQIATGSYVGTGTYGARNPTVINCGFKPKVVLIYVTIAMWSSRYVGINGGGRTYRSNGIPFLGYDNNASVKMDTYTGDSSGCFVMLVGHEQMQISSGVSSGFGIVSTENDTGVSYYANFYAISSTSSSSATNYQNAMNQFNSSGVVYHYVAIA